MHERVAYHDNSFVIEASHRMAQCDRYLVNRATFGFRSPVLAAESP